MVYAAPELSGLAASVVLIVGLLVVLLVLLLLGWVTVYWLDRLWGGR